MRLGTVCERSFHFAITFVGASCFHTFKMASHADTRSEEDGCDPDAEAPGLTKYIIPHSTPLYLNLEVVNLKGEVKKPRVCLQASLELQKSLLKCLDQGATGEPGERPSPQRTPPVPRNDRWLDGYQVD